MKKDSYLRKDNASTIHMFSIVFTVVFIALLLIIFAGIASNINRRNDVDLIARKYLLKMEIEGGLTDELKEDLTKELGKYGVININLNGSTIVDDSSVSNYGEVITLSISGDMRFITYNSNVNKIFDNSITLIPLEIKKSSTSKN